MVTNILDVRKLGALGGTTSVRTLAGGNPRIGSLRLSFSLRLRIRGYHIFLNAYQFRRQLRAGYPQGELGGLVNE